jgi:hypothetical protein
LKTAIAVFIISIITLQAFADGNPFMEVRERDQWALEQVMEHKAPEVTWAGESNGSSESHRVKKASVGTPTPTPFKVQTYIFQTETDEAKVCASITDFGSNFTIDVTSDQAIQGWLLKRQSTRQVFLKGASESPYKCRIKVDRPYLKDYGLTVYVTQDSDPAFIQLF